jgi:hypothetical protein
VTARAALRLHRQRTTGRRGRRRLDARRWASLVAARPEIPEPELTRLWLRANVMLALSFRESEPAAPRR